MADPNAKKGPNRATLAKCFKVLGLPGYAKEAEVRRAYRLLVLREHPDKGGDQEKFQAIQTAYNTLLTKFEREAEERKKAYENLSAKGYRSADADKARKGEEKPDVAELRQGEDGGVLVPSSDLKKLGDEAFAAGDYARALEYYNTAAAYAKIDNMLAYAELYLARSHAYAKLEEWDAALTDTERALSLRPIWLPAAVANAQALTKLERWAAAVEAYRHACSIDARDPALTALAADAQAGLARAERVLLQESSLATLSGHKGAVRCVAFCPPEAAEEGDEAGEAEAAHGVRQTAWVATGSADGTARVWEAPSGNCLFTLKGHCGPIVRVRWCPDGTRLLATAAMDGTARLWEFEPDEDQDGRMVATCINTLEGHMEPLTDLVFDRFGGVLATTSEDNTAKVWDTETGLLLHALPPLHKAVVNTACFSPNGRTLTTASDDTTARVWDLMGDVEEPGDCLHTLGWDSGLVNQVTYTPCGRLIIIATHLPEVSKTFYRILVWSAVSGRICKWYDGHTGIIHSLAWKPFPDDDEGDVLVSSSQDGTLKVWEISGEPTGKGECLMEVDHDRGRAIKRPGYMEVLYEGSVYAAKYNPAGTRFATGCRDGRVRIYDPDEWTAQGTDWGGHTATVRDLDWSADGTVLVTCSDDGTARLWAAVQDPPVGSTARPLPSTHAAAAGVAAPQAAEAAEDTVVEALEAELAALRARIEAAGTPAAMRAEAAQLLAVEGELLSLQREHRWIMDQGTPEERTSFGKTFGAKLQALRSQKLALQAALEAPEPSPEAAPVGATAAAAAGDGMPAPAEEEVADEYAQRRAELARKAARLTQESAAEQRELLEVEGAILTLQEQQRDMAAQPLTDQTAPNKAAFRKRFTQEMKVLRARRAELMRKVRELTNQISNQAQEDPHDHRSNTHAPDLSADRTLMALEQALASCRSRYGLRPEGAPLLEVQAEMVALYKKRCLVAGASSETMSELMKSGFYAIYETSVASLSSREHELSASMGLSAVLGPILASADLSSLGAAAPQTAPPAAGEVESAASGTMEGPMWGGSMDGLGMESAAGLEGPDLPGPMWPPPMVSTEEPMGPQMRPMQGPMMGPTLGPVMGPVMGPEMPPTVAGPPSPLEEKPESTLLPQLQSNSRELLPQAANQRAKMVYKTPWANPDEVMEEKEAALARRRAALAAAGPEDAEAAAHERELLDVEGEMLRWQQRRVEMVAAADTPPAEKVKFNKEYAEVMARLRTRFNDLTVFCGEAPTVAAAARKARNETLNVD